MVCDKAETVSNISRWLCHHAVKQAKTECNPDDGKYTPSQNAGLADDALNSSVLEIYLALSGKRTYLGASNADSFNERPRRQKRGRFIYRLECACVHSLLSFMEKVIPRGTLRENGKVFAKYDRRKSGEIFERWVTPAVLAKQNEQNRRYALARRRKAGFGAEAQSCKDYRKNNRSYVRAFKSKQRAQKRNASISTNMEFVTQFYETSRRLTKCTGFPWHVDHVYPLSRGGSHHENNLQVLPARINMIKHAKV